MRFLDLATQLEKVESRRNYPRAKLVRASTYHPTAEQAANQRERIRLVRQLNALIRKVVPSMKPSLDCQGGTWLRPRPTRRKQFGFVNTFYRRGNEFVWDEISVFERMIDLAVDGGIYRIGQCAECRRWMFRSKTNKNYCTFKCQQAFARRSPKYKEQRKSYMQGYRAREKKRNERAKRQVAINGRRGGRG